MDRISTPHKGKGLCKVEVQYWDHPNAKLNENIVNLWKHNFGICLCSSVCIDIDICDYINIYTHRYTQSV